MSNPPQAGEGAYALIALGANLPFQGLEGPALLSAAVEEIERTLSAPARRSSFWASPAWPPSDQPDFTNAVIAIRPPPSWTPREILAALLEIEARFGRVRTARWAARTMDLDLLDLSGRVLDEPGLTLPHPRLYERAFVLAPLAELAPAWRHPVLGDTAAELLHEAPARAAVRRLAGAP